MPAKAKKIVKTTRKKPPGRKTAAKSAKKPTAAARKKPAAASRKKRATATKPKSRAAFQREMRKKLTQEKEHLLSELAMKIRQESDAEKKGIGDIYDIASNERERELTLMLGDRDRDRLGEVDTALERIEDKDYGLCEECGEPIGQERLRALPFTTLCVECKSRSEKGSKAAGRFAEKAPGGILEKLGPEDEY